jgi:hypothetical protein
LSDFGFGASVLILTCTVPALPFSLVGAMLHGLGNMVYVIGFSKQSQRAVGICGLFVRLAYLLAWVK